MAKNQIWSEPILICQGSIHFLIPHNNSVSYKNCHVKLMSSFPRDSLFTTMFLFSYPRRQPHLMGGGRCGFICDGRRRRRWCISEIDVLGWCRRPLQCLSVRSVLRFFAGICWLPRLNWSFWVYCVRHLPGWPRPPLHQTTWTAARDLGKRGFLRGMNEFQVFFIHLFRFVATPSNTPHSAGAHSCVKCCKFPLNGTALAGLPSALKRQHGLGV